MSFKTDFYQIDETIRRMDEFFCDAPSNIFVKDRQGGILYANKQLIALMGINTFEEIVGKTDRDFVDSDAADMLREFDKKALLGPIRCEEKVVIPCGDFMVFASEKKPFYHQGKVVGTWGASVALSTLKGVTDEVVYFDSRDDQILTLTKKQKECIKHLLQGKTARETAESMQLSVRTVENYIYAIRSGNNIKNLKSLLLHVRSIR